MMRKWIENNFDHISNIISAIGSILLSLLASYVYDSLKNEKSTMTNNYIIFTLIVFICCFIIIFSIISNRIKNFYFKEADLNEYIQKAYFAVQDLSLESQSILQERNDKELSGWFMENMQLAVNKCYDFFYSSFSKSKTLIEETKFEVTFMTLSYIDGKITIPCSCNKEKRTPTSMLMRKRDPDIYQSTVTAEIYREYNTNCKPSFKIIENTSKQPEGSEPYNFVYENQKERIKSSVVLPILSHWNELLGTLVVHCNTPGFFKNEQSEFWYEILQLFASEIGKNRLLLDYSIKDKGDYPF